MLNCLNNLIICGVFSFLLELNEKANKENVLKDVEIKEDLYLKVLFCKKIYDNHEFLCDMS